MSTLSTRTLAALAFERGEEFDPALTLVLAPLADDLALLAGARALVCEPSPVERRRRRERARRNARGTRAQRDHPSVPATAGPSTSRPA